MMDNMFDFASFLVIIIASSGCFRLAVGGIRSLCKNSNIEPSTTDHNQILPSVGQAMAAQWNKTTLTWW